MNKNFLIEQCRRLDVIHENESDELSQEGKDTKWLIVHNSGHKRLIDEFLDYINNVEGINRQALKKWLRKRISQANQVIRKLDEKYNHFKHNEDMATEDEQIYYINDGITCIAYTLINIVDSKRYISKINK